MLRLCSILGALAIFVSSPAWSGDASFLNIIGFSADGRYFAFEQYGTQDGSGFAYSDVVITDLKNDALVKGTPIRAIAPDEQASKNSIRAKARGQAAERLKTLHIDQPAEIIGSNPITERVDDRKTMAFNLYFEGLGGQLTPPEITKDNDFELVLKSVSLPVAMRKTARRTVFHSPSARQQRVWSLKNTRTLLFQPRAIAPVIMTLIPLRLIVMTRGIPFS